MFRWQLRKFLPVTLMFLVKMRDGNARSMVYFEKGKEDLKVF